MKLQDVILKAMAKKLTWIEAAEIAGMSVRNMQRKRQAYQDYGYNGLFDRRRGKNSYHCSRQIRAPVLSYTFVWIVFPIRAGTRFLSISFKNNEQRSTAGPRRRHRTG